MERFDRHVLIAFLVASAVWTAGAAYTTRGDLLVTAVVAAYLLLGTALLATRRLPTGRGVLGVWAGAVVLAVVAGAVVSLGAVLVGVLAASAAVAGWSLTGFLLLHVATGGPVPPGADDPTTPGAG